MKQLKTFFILSLAFVAGGLIMSCDQGGDKPAGNNNNNNTNKEAAAPSDDTKKTITMVVSHKVLDYAKWRPAFDKDEANRQAANMKVSGVFQEATDLNNVSISLLVEDTASAKKFGRSAELKAAMTAGGVVGEPEVKFYELVIAEDTTAAKNENRLFLVAKVTDYNAFSKVFADNDSLRKARGISTVVVARNIEDPNEVAIALTAADMATLKSHFESPEVKASMQKGTITGEPMVQFAIKAKEVAPAM